MMTIMLVLLFAAGYTAIALEYQLGVNKAAVALVTGVLCWTAYVLLGTATVHQATDQLGEYLGEVAGILFFLMGAMTIVELIDAHDGFELVTEKIQTGNKKKLVWLVAFLTFFLSAVLDNLTTAIVMVSLLRKIISNRQDRLLLAGLVVIAANAGGAWSPIGDVTTTMLWMGGQLTAVHIMLTGFLASLACLLLPALLISRQMNGKVERPVAEAGADEPAKTSRRHQILVFWLGISCLLFVPVFKALTHLPPYMGILLGLGVMWVITEIMHSSKDEAEKGLLSVNHALRKIDTPSILFFLGILLSIGALQAAGVLTAAATWMSAAIGDIKIITVSIGLLSSVVDNVPLVAAVQGMYSMEQFGVNHHFWSFLAYCAGTGGSCLIIGSAAGIAAMGIEKIEFGWYLKKIAWLALLGYLAGVVVFLLQQWLTGVMG